MPSRTYSDVELSAAVAGSRSWREVLRTLGLAATSSAALRSVRRRADHLALDHRHFTGGRRWTDADLAEAVAAARSWSGVIERLGLAGGSSSSALKGHAARLGLDHSHFGRVRPPVSGPDAKPAIRNLPRSGSLLAASWLSLCGFEILWPLEPCRYDFATRPPEGALLRIQVKTTRVRSRASYVVTLSTPRGGRTVYDPEEIDHYFVVDGSLDYYLIPVAVVGGMHAITLSGYDEWRLSREWSDPLQPAPTPSHP